MESAIVHHVQPRIEPGAVIVELCCPGRWSRETVLDEHRLLRGLVDNEIPAVAPLPFPDGDTLHENHDGTFFALFPRVGGRSPEDQNR